MGYRDEQESLRAQVKDLQEQLADANLKIERLTGEAPPRPGEVIERSRLLDAPSKVVLERELEFEIGDEGFEAVAALLRPRLGAVAQVGRTLTARGFSLACADGATRIRLVGDYGGLAAGTLSASVLLGGFMALCTFAIQHDLVNRNLAEVNVLWMVPLFIAALFPIARRLGKSKAHSLVKEQRATLEAVAEIAQRHAKKKKEQPAAEKVRVAVSPSASEEGAAEMEAAAEAEAEASAERERIAAGEA